MHALQAKYLAMNNHMALGEHEQARPIALELKNKLKRLDSVPGVDRVTVTSCVAVCLQRTEWLQLEVV